MPATFDELVASRKAWIAEVLEPWCREAKRFDLLKAETEWGDIAGRVDAGATLWTWAWSRFPALVHEGLTGVDETRPVVVTLQDGTQTTGFPDSRRSERGMLTLVGSGDDGATVDSGPYSIDDIANVEPA